MKKIITFVFLICAFAFSSSLFAQATEKGDTLIIGPQNHDGTNIGALNYYINSDTTDSGERAHSVYKILRGQTYILTATISANFPFVLVADAPDDANKPPVIRAGLKEDGSTVSPLMDIADDWIMKNVYVSGIAPTGDASISWYVIQVTKPYAKVMLDGCVFENTNAGWCFIHNYFGGTHASITVKNSTIRNSLNKGGTWAGAFMGLTITDTIRLINNTFFNLQGPAFQGDEQKGILYTEVDHNTFVNGLVHQWTHNMPVEMKVTNNIFYNCYSLSGGPVEVNKHPDKEFHGIIHLFRSTYLLDSMWVDKYDPNGDGVLKEEERAYTLKNNAWFYSQEIKDYWAAFDSLATQSWYNNAVKEFFVNNQSEKEVTIVGGAKDGSDTTWTYPAHPLFVEMNTMEENPGFTNTGGSEAKLAANLTGIRDGSGGVLWNYETDGSLTQFEWPLPEDLSYSNATLLTAADGFPVGDLNWFPDKKADWITDVEENGHKVIDEYRVSQNYPNPFNPSTNIEFAIPENGLVSLKVYNVLGEEVAELINKELTTGTYTVNFNASKLTSGIYFYTLSSGNFVQTKKMLLLK